MDYETLKIQLKEEFGRKWSSKLADKAVCSTDLINKVFNKERGDFKNIFEKGVQLLKESRANKEQLQKELKDIA